MRALSIRQPWAELILRGIKTVEYRTRPTRIIGERFYIYAAKKLPVVSCQLPGKARINGDNIVVPDEPLPPWMIELAEGLRIWKPGALPTGVIVGSAVIGKVTQTDRLYEWHLTDVKRVKTFRKPTGHPQPAWFNPF